MKMLPLPPLGRESIVDTADAIIGPLSQCLYRMVVSGSLLTRLDAYIPSSMTFVSE